jgi:hypothetical protein
MTNTTRVLHANCFPSASAQARADLLLTDEAIVAAGATSGLAVASGEAHIDEQLAHETSAAMFRAAFGWFLSRGGEDQSIVAGVSAGDLAGSEAALTILIPAARGVLSTLAALDDGLEPSGFTTVVPAGHSRYARVETLAADAAHASLRTRLGDLVQTDRILSADARNAWLREKYARTRDVDFLAASDRRRGIARALALRTTDVLARLRRRRDRTLLVLEYNPSHAFARNYGARRRRDWGLLCWPARPRDLIAIVRGGDRAIVPFVPDTERQQSVGVERRLRERSESLAGRDLSVAGVDLWPFVEEPLLALAERYGRYTAALAAPLRAALEQGRVGAVLTPFDTPPHARLIVRVAQALDIPTFVMNDGYKGDDIQLEGMTADHALTWSAAMRENYYARRANGAIVTGNPRSEDRRYATPNGAGRRRVLVGGYTFSPVDINCRRADGERFLDEVLGGIAMAGAHVSAKVTVKLHPADDARYYQEILTRHPTLEVKMLTEGDVIDLFDRCDVYVTTYSTSLLEAIAGGLPSIYYRVNKQRLAPPFSADGFVEARSASTSTGLAEILADRRRLEEKPPAGWVKHYLGPRTGATDRVIASIDRQLDSPNPIVSRLRTYVNT